MRSVNQIIESGLKLSRGVASKGFFHLLSANVVIRIFGFASQLFVAWILTPEDIGRIKIMQSFMAVLIITSGFGFNVSTLKLCSEERSTGEKLFLFRKGILYTLFPLLFSYLAIFLLSWSGMLSSDPVINTLMIYLAIGLLPLTLNGMFFSLLQALKRIKVLAKVQLVTKAIGVLIIIGLTYLILLKGYVVAVVIGYAITLVVLVIFNRDILHNAVQKAPNPFKLHLNYALYSMLANLTSTLSKNIDILILNYLVADRTAIGYYSFAVVLIGLLFMLEKTIQQITNPFFSSKSSDIRKWHDSFKKYNRINFYFITLIFLVSLIIVPIFLKYGFAGKYEDSILFFILLSISWFFKSNVVILSSALFGLGKIKTNFFIGLITLIFSAIVIYLSTNFFGIIGSACGMILNGIFTLIISKIFFHSIINHGQKDY